MAPDPLSDDVLVLPHFGTADDVSALLSAFQVAVAANAADLRPLRTDVRCRNIADICDPTLLEQISSVRNRMVDAMLRVSPLVAQYPDLTMLSEMRVGDSHVLHADAERHTSSGWGPNHTPWRTHAGLLYLNTSGVDYRGGVLRLPGVGRTIVPTKGMFVAFPSGRRHIHEVTAVEAGKRHSLSVWLTGDVSRTELLTVRLEPDPSIGWRRPDIGGVAHAGPTHLAIP